MLTLENLSKTFHPGTPNEVRALKSISLDVAEGEFITIIGSNGAGKSTLLTAIAGDFLPDAGKIAIDGRDVTALPTHKRARAVGRVFQDPLKGTCATMSIAENLALAARRGLPRGLGRGVRPADRQSFQERLKRLGLGLEQRLDDRVGLLSGGQRQALTMLMATLIPPRLLLLDEHTAALDPKTAAQILELTRAIVSESRLTTLMVTHNMVQALTLGDRLIMLHHGEIILDVAGAEKKTLTVEDLLTRFYAQSGEVFSSDKMLLV